MNNDALAATSLAAGVVACVAQLAEPGTQIPVSAGSSPAARTLIDGDSRWLSAKQLILQRLLF